MNNKQNMASLSLRNTNISMIAVSRFSHEDGVVSKNIFGRCVCYCLPPPAPRATTKNAQTTITAHNTIGFTPARCLSLSLSHSCPLTIANLFFIKVYWRQSESLLAFSCFRIMFNMRALLSRMRSSTNYFMENEISLEWQQV